MNRSRYLRILWTVTAVCVVLGIFMRQVRQRRYEQEFEAYEYAPAEAEEEYYAGDEYYAGSGIPGVGEFRSIRIDGFVGSVNITSGGDYNYWYGESGETGGSTDFALEDGILTVRQSGVPVTDMERAGTLTIEVPDSVCLEDVDILVDAGSVSVYGLYATRCEIQNSAGSIDVNESYVENATFRVDLGDLRVSNVDFTQMEAELGAGNAEFWVPFVEETDLALKTDLGRVDINGQSYGNGYTRDQGLSRKLTVHNGMGNISVSY